MCSTSSDIDFVHILYCANIIIISIYAHYTYYVCIILIPTRDKRIVSNFVKELRD